MPPGLYKIISAGARELMMILMCFAAIMPPVSNNEYDLQLQSTVRDLENLRDDISSDICFLYCAGNVPRKCQTQQPLDPKQLYEDLKAHNFKW